MGAARARIFASVVIAAGATTAPSALAESPAAPGDDTLWHPSVETDPETCVYWALGSLAYSVHVLVKPPAPHWRFGLDNYAGDVPSAFLASDLKSWQVRYSAYGAQAQYFVERSTRGFFFGSFVLMHRWQYRIGDGAATTWRLGVMPEVGFQFLPFGEHGLYFTPWVGAVIDGRFDGSPVVGGKSYPEQAISPILALHVGYEF